jgi:hypothetical protein
MKKILGKSWIGLIVLLVGCDVFGPVDPLPPTFSALELVFAGRTQITVKGDIQEPASKNDRQEKKSGRILEYGLVYGKNENLNTETGTVIKLDSVVENLPITIEREISGLAANTDYYVALYARNEGGGVGYSEILKAKTTNAPTERFNQKSITLKRSEGSYFDLDNGTVSASETRQSDAVIDIYSISGRGTVLAITAANGLIVKNMGVIDFNSLIYDALLKVRDYDAKGVSFIVNAQSVNTVIVFKTIEGRYGRWRIESATTDALVMSLVTYDN